MQNHIKEGMGNYKSYDRLEFSDFFGKLINKHGRHGSVLLGAKINKMQKN